MKPLRTAYRGVNYGGGRGIQIVQKVIEGPVSALDRTVTVTLTFDDIDGIIRFRDECKSRYEESEHRVADINRHNQEEDTK